MIKIISVNTSERKGTIKTPAESAELTNQGVAGDAHSGPWPRQVSLLGLESIRKFESQASRTIRPGEFAENLTTEGMDLSMLKPLDRFLNDRVELEITQIGKECHGTSCSIFKEVGNCVMPKEGIFARVIRPGGIKSGDTLEYHPKTYRARIITLSDRASAGLYEDLSGPRIKSLLDNFFASHASPLTSHLSLLPDDPEQLTTLLRQARQESFDFVITTGGTGIGPRDYTPEVVRSVVDREIPGIMEAVRMRYGLEKPAALLSRSVAGVMGTTLVFALPGSVRAVTEYMEEILKSLMHMVRMVHGLEGH